MAPCDICGLEPARGETECSRCGLPKAPPCTRATDGMHRWGTDGVHANEYCKLCFCDRPRGARDEYAEYEDGE